MFIDDFESQQDVFSSFNVSDSEVEGVKVLFASYTYEDYSGSAFVLFEKNSKLYEVNGSHCSCFGLEDQWEPEETSEQVILFQLSRSDLGYGPEAAAHLEKVMLARFLPDASSEE